jgi:CheY-like chemotaxis protein
LVVDDEPTIAHLVRASVKAADFPCDVVYCSDGAQARLKATEGQFDLITLDRNMPRLDGESALKAIKGDPRSADIPVVMITAQKDQGFEHRALELGAAAVLSKPFQPRQLAHTLREILAAEHSGTRAPGQGDVP